MTASTPSRSLSHGTSLRRVPRDKANQGWKWAGWDKWDAWDKWDMLEATIRKKTGALFTFRQPALPGAILISAVQP